MIPKRIDIDAITLPLMRAEALVAILQNPIEAQDLPREVCVATNALTHAISVELQAAMNVSEDPEYSGEDKQQEATPLPEPTTVNPSRWPCTAAE